VRHTADVGVAAVPLLRDRDLDRVDAIDVGRRPVRGAAVGRGQIEVSDPAVGDGGAETADLVRRRDSILEDALETGLVDGASGNAALSDEDGVASATVD
jgi:hypothetical protein